MELEVILNYTRQGLLMVLWLCLPVVLGSAATGLIIAIFQAATQLQDQAAAAAMRLIVGALIVALTAGWIGLSTKDFVDDMWRNAGYRAPPPITR
jgi:type III secretory pathway component EscS